jgi:hypothetical protein
MEASMSVVTASASVSVKTSVQVKDNSHPLVVSRFYQDFLNR